VDGSAAYILTAYHVIAEDINQERRSVQVELYPDTLRDAQLSEQRSDKNNDIAVLIVDNLPSPPPTALPWGDSDAIKDAQRVFAIGHPRGALNWAVTDGFISGLQAGKIYFSGTAVNRGNSGGPLINDQGVFVGMNQQLVEGSLGIALMSNVIRPLLRGWVPGFDGREKDMLLVPDRLV
jgi:S1-C subfamily serine protease